MRSRGLLLRNIDGRTPFRRSQIPDVISQYRRAPEPWGLLMRRRDFIKVVAGSAITWPLATRAQQRTMPVIGVLSPATSEADANRMNAIRQGLKDAGYIEGENVMIEYRSAENQLDRLPALAGDLVRRSRCPRRRPRLAADRPWRHRSARGSPTARCRPACARGSRAARCRMPGWSRWLQ